MNEVVCGDSVEELALFPANHFDSLVCDPPCGIDLSDLHWDSSYGGRDGWIEVHRKIFAEVLRVLKPGAYALAWAIPRTSHWTATALEDAGFDVRDVVTHVYGSGFPKGSSIDKRVDRLLGVFDGRPVLGWKEVPDYGAGAFSAVGGASSGEAKPKKVVDVTGPASEVARRFEGWQTTLKPAGEPWILARKPHGTTDAQCVVDWGTGALNVPGCGMDGKWPPNFVMTHASDCDERCAPGCPALDLGKAARFFPSFRYCPKPSQRERSAAGRNDHPTLKPVELMRWMVRLVTPPGGRVLDVFGGSGTTGVAAILEGRKVTLIEREPEFADVCRRRVALAEAEAGEDFLL